jgi:hypothetical protein
MASFRLRIEFDDCYQASERIFAILRRMGFVIADCQMSKERNGAYRMQLCFIDPTPDPHHRSLLVHRITQVASAVGPLRCERGRLLFRSCWTQLLTWVESARRSKHHRPSKPLDHMHLIARHFSSVTRFACEQPSSGAGDCIKPEAPEKAC